MSWQDELTRLDEELAAGHLSAEDYRRRRDELLSRDASNPEGSGEPQSAPFPPAFRWETGPPEETTQIMQPIGDEPDRTQVVHGGPQQPPTDPDRTQFVSTGHDPQQQWNAGGDDSAPPWASSDIPPIQQPNSAWMAQGQPFGSGSFEAPRKSRKGRVIGVVVAVVLVLAAGAVGVYALLAGGGGNPQAAPATAAQEPAGAGQAAPASEPAEPATTTAPSPAPGADLPDPAPIGGDGLPRVLATLADLQGAAVLSPEEFAVYQQSGTAGSKLLSTTFSDGPRVNLLITRVGSPEQAMAARDELAALQEAAGFTPAPGPEGLRSSFLVDDPDLDPTVRGYYSSGDLLIRLDVVGQEPRPTAQRYDAAADQQLAALPADA